MCVCNIKRLLSARAQEECFSIAGLKMLLCRTFILAFFLPGRRGVIAKKKFGLAGSHFEGGGWKGRTTFKKQHLMVQETLNGSLVPCVDGYYT